jgi:hypothetical protein
MECFNNVDNYYSTPYEPENLSFESEEDNENSIKKIDLEKLARAIPESILAETIINIGVSSKECFTLKPCEKRKVKTGLFLKTFLPIRNYLYFEGYYNNIGIKTESRCVISLLEKEFCVEVYNFSVKNVFIPAEMPLGKLMIKPSI